MAAKRSDLTRALRIYRAFREQEPKRASYYRLKLPKAVARMGPCEFIGYMTTHNGKSALYVHEFAPGSRPLLYAGPKHQQLLFIGGRYHVTGRGITDLDPRGRVIDYPRRYHINPIPRRYRPR
jgi:hypothetical protein